jgi:hypothetical protein
MPGYYNRDQQNRMIFQLTDSIVRLLGTVTIDSNSTTGYIDIPSGMAGTPFYFCSFGQTQESQDSGRLVKLEGRRVSWSGISAGTVIRVGVY